MRATIIAVERDSDLRRKARGGYNSGAIVQRFREERGIKSKTPFFFLFVWWAKAVKASNTAEA